MLSIQLIEKQVCYVLKNLEGCTWFWVFKTCGNFELNLSVKNIKYQLPGVWSSLFSVSDLSDALEIFESKGKKNAEIYIIQYM